MNSIATENLDIAYDNALIVENLGMAIPHNKITSIIGPNGCENQRCLRRSGVFLKKKKAWFI